MSKSFTLHPRLAEDTIFVTDLALCRVTLMNDSRFPWLILIPRRDDLREMHSLDTDAQQSLIQELSLASKTLEAITDAEKMNVAALGNAVPQLHIHVIARFSTDPAWPKPVWGIGEATPYPVAPNEDETRNTLIGALQQRLRL